MRHDLNVLPVWFRENQTVSVGSNVEVPGATKWPITHEKQSGEKLLNACENRSIHIENESALRDRLLLAGISVIDARICNVLH